MKKLIIFAILIFIFSACQKSHSLSEVYDLKCEYITNPIGIDRTQPIFQWKIKDSRRGAAQTAYQIIVEVSDNDQAENIVWDSEKVDSGQSVFVKYNGDALMSGKSYSWKVRIWDQEGEVSKWSEPAIFEMGFLNQSDWQAKWISRDNSDKDRSVFMRKEFDLGSEKIKKARAYVTGLGNYVLFINGKKVGDDLLTPGWTHYPKRLEYQVYDISQMLESGENVVGSLLGNMWWSGGLGWQGGQKYSEEPLKFLVQINIEFEDGTQKVLISDESWKWHDSPIVADNIYHGEIYDANLELPEWDKPGFDDSEWKNVEMAGYEGVLSGPYAPALCKQMEVAPKEINEPVKGEYVFDLGQNIVGWAKVKFHAEKGDSVKLRFAELLHEDGTVAQENLRSAKATDIIISDGNETTWEPNFTYHGFRYVQVSGLKYKPELTDLIGKVIHADAPIVGNIECSNDLINQINKNVMWGQRGNFFAAPTDCPQRDERLGWMGDAQIFAPTANFNMNLAKYWAKWMFDITDGQDEEGWVYDVNPPIVVGGPSKPGWGDAVVVIPWLSYLYYGDTRIIEDNYDAMKAWVDYMDSESENYIYVWEQPGNEGWYGYGDWIAVEPSPSISIGTAYFYYSSKLLSQMAEIAGKNSDAEKYAKLAENIAEAYQKEYWLNDVGNYFGETQTANLLPLAFGITPENLKGKVVDNLVEDVLEHDVHPTTGFLGTGYILPMLSQNGHPDLAYQMMNKTDYPSWGYMVKKGATTIWELWNSDTEPPEGMNSRNHFALGCVGEWIWNNVAGINVCHDQPGFKKVLVKPQPVGGLKWAKATYETNYGKIIVDWKIENETFTLNLTVPENSTAVVELPQMNEGAVISESGLAIDSSEIEGLTVNEKGQILASAGNYIFTVAN